MWGVSPVTKARGQAVGSDANNRLLLSSAQSDQIAEHNQSGGNAHTGLQWSTGLQHAHSLDQIQPRRTARSASSSWAWG
jgi:hypothetical protein